MVAGPACTHESTAGWKKTADMAKREQSTRGCIYFNFGTDYALQLLVSVHSLRKHYGGPITVFLLADRHSSALKNDIESLGASVILVADLSKSHDRHRIFHESPYETTLSMDADTIFLGPIDSLWEPLEREGLLVTRFSAPPYGIDGKLDAHGEFSRISLLENIRELLGPARFELAVRRMIDDRIDMNIGVLGISRDRGAGFLSEWAELMEKGHARKIDLLDEMLVVGLIAGYPHHLADEIWNCPANEMFRRTNLADAIVIHYFADGYPLWGDQRMGRNAATWAGRKWYAAYREAATALNLRPWRFLDPNFDRRAEPALANGAAYAFRTWLKDMQRGIRPMRNRILGRP